MCTAPSPPQSCKFIRAKYSSILIICVSHHAKLNALYIVGFLVIITVLVAFLNILIILIFENLLIMILYLRFERLWHHSVDQWCEPLFQVTKFPSNPSGSSVDARFPGEHLRLGFWKFELLLITDLLSDFKLFVYFSVPSFFSSPIGDNVPYRSHRFVWSDEIIVRELWN